MTVNFEIAAVALALGLAFGLLLAWARVGGGAAGVAAAGVVAGAASSCLEHAATATISSNGAT